MAHMTHNPKVFFTKEDIEQYEFDIRMQKRIERYSLARRFAYGHVLDVACGVGYGSYLISHNPDVTSVTGADYNDDAIDWAEKTFKSETVSFERKGIQEIDGEFDFLISLETIEHLENPEDLHDMMVRCKINEAVVSFPRRKTTHYNSYHLWDMDSVDVDRMFRNFAIFERIEALDSVFLRLLRHKRRKAQKKWPPIKG